MADIPMQLKALFQDSKVGRDIEIERLLKLNKRLRNALEGMVQDWDKLSRYGSPMAKAANERVTEARKVLEDSKDV
jgi:hypothetical protein